VIYTLIWTPAFVNALKTLPTGDAVDVANNVMSLARDPRPIAGTVAELGDDMYVLHVGEYDVLYDITGLTVRALLVSRRTK
jgi:mRNA-degrading endonuclease RelE of RelBE toxin-antitoxin system